MNWFQRRKLCSLIAVSLAAAGCTTTPKHGPELLQLPQSEPSVKLTQPQIADMQFALGRTLEQRGETDQAMQAYTEALKHDAKRIDAHIRKAIVLTQQGKFTEAIASYQCAYDMNPENPDLFCNLGYTLYLQERWQESEKALKRCLGMKPDHHRAHNNLGLVMARTGRADEAVAEFRQAGVSEADARINLAHAHTLNKDLPAAKRCYEEALALQPASEPAKSGLANVTAVAARMTNNQAITQADYRQAASSEKPTK